MLIGRQLDFVSQPAGDILHKVVSVGRRATPDTVGDDQLGIGVKGRPRPSVAPLPAALLGDVLGLRADEAPDFIALNPAASEVASRYCQVTCRLKALGRRLRPCRAAGCLTSQWCWS